MYGRAWRVIAGADGTRAGLPIGELLAPLPLGALAVLVANDWWWKPTGALPAWATGKLSDVAGLVLLPLVLTASGALVLRVAARAGAPVDWTLRRWKLGVAIAVTAALLVATKLSPGVAAELASGLGRRARIVADPTDLLALPALALAWWQGRRTIARVPYGRVAWLATGGRAAPVRVELADVVGCGGAAARVETLAGAIEAWRAGGPAAPVDQALAALR